MSGRSTPIPGNTNKPRAPSSASANVSKDQLASARLAASDEPALPQIPPRSQNASPSPLASANASNRSDLPGLGTSFRSTSFNLAAASPNAANRSHRPSIDQVSEQEKARIVRRHLANTSKQAGEREDFPVFDDDPSNAAADASHLSVSNLGQTPSDQKRAPTPEQQKEQASDFETPTYHKLLGGDVTHDLFKYASDIESRASDRPRSRSFTEGSTPMQGGARRPSNAVHFGDNTTIVSTEADLEEGEIEEGHEDPTLDIRAIREPGGFRRNYLHRKAAQSRTESPSPDRRAPFTRSFVEFLSLYGHFGGEALEEIDEEDEEYYDEEETVGSNDYEEANGERARSLSPHDMKQLAHTQADERTPLFQRKRSQSRDVRSETKGSLTRQGSRLSRRRSHSAAGRQGDASVMQAVLMIIKGFVGTGILFLGKAFFNGGLLFSVCMIVGIALISLFSFLLLVESRLVIPGSFGDMGEQLYGTWLRYAILASIALSQMGFVSAYTIFVAENLQAFFSAVTHNKAKAPIEAYIFIQLVAFLPLAMIRNIQKLSGTALVADAFILIGLLYIFGNEAAVIAHRGVADVVMFNPKDWALLVGTAVFSFEGIGLIIPITESMREPEKFPRVLTYCMIGLLILFAGGGSLAYMAYGSNIKTVVIVNLPQDDKFVNAVQFLYSVAIMLSTPLQLFPAVRIMENGLFSRSGKHSTKVKWEKNMFRSLVVLACILIAYVAASDLDKFVSIVGSVACVPLCYCYPAMLHYRACAKTRKQKAADIALFIFGCAACLFCSVQTIRQLLGDV